MIPQEKANELVDKIYYIIGKNYSKGDGFSLQLTEEAKQCALVTVDELIIHTDWHEVNYWQEVKQEIEKL